MTHDEIKDKIANAKAYITLYSDRRNQLMDECGKIGHVPHVYLKTETELGIDCAVCGYGLSRQLFMGADAGWAEMTDEQCIAEWRRDRE